MQLIFEQIRTGGDRNFGYLLGDRAARQAVLVDPSFTPEALVERARAQELTVTHIINTHGHGDHTNGNARAAQLTRARIAAHPDSSVRPEVRLQDGEELALGALRLRIMHTPGHSDDHLVVYEETYNLLITGDLLFVGKIGGTANDADARVEWNVLRQVMAAFPEWTTVWPGHDYGARPSSTLYIERRANPFLLCANLNEFLRLKDDWPIFKERHGLR
ncbi:MAG: hydroxyacylglutathione hydrolase family protein [Planctomycetota bacterium]|nr:hydroxyacylglutathione hydrolase family protein [Planctomycetota bacterium]